MAQPGEPREHHKSKHILRKYHIIRELIDRGDVIIVQIPMEGNVVDPLTKPLPYANHYKRAKFIGMKYLDEA